MYICAGLTEPLQLAYKITCTYPFHFNIFGCLAKVCVCVEGGGGVATQNIFIDEDEYDKTNNLTLITPSKDSKQPPNNLTCWFCYTMLASSQFLLSDKFVAWDIFSESNQTARITRSL